ncbi:acyl-CoA-binding protein [Mangrovicoccus ximenensis]|uniref:acyl-CoA-binding protein n=1 Tax=Mangrovicoccus ximenensis TaxID=1911570 RepID=UPI000D387FC4|nr:acyl-CoA-binding protein [Mangrovicoccus ximenensis]
MPKSSGAAPVRRTLEESIAFRAEFLTNYQNEVYSKRYLAEIERVRAAEAKAAKRKGEEEWKTEREKEAGTCARDRRGRKRCARERDEDMIRRSPILAKISRSKRIASSKFCLGRTWISITMKFINENEVVNGRATIILFLVCVPKRRNLSISKQAKFGPVDTSRPGMFSMKERAKWDAWKAVEGKSSEEAMNDYITKVKQLLKHLSKLLC